jgi:hypothetical protein
MWGKDRWYSSYKLEHHLMVASASIKLDKLLISWLGSDPIYASVMRIIDQQKETNNKCSSSNVPPPSTTTATAPTAADSSIGNLPITTTKHLTNTESLPLLLQKTAALSGLSSTGSIASWMGAVFGGRWNRSPSGFACDWVGATGTFQSNLALAMETSNLEGTERRVLGGDGNVGEWAWVGRI